ncbi:MAG: class I SAM-dependent methyltransferase [Kofleriaceae bacterium]|nr:class I SAM-dependent methyltransferase [Kofleriaceae bacterium]
MVRGRSPLRHPGRQARAALAALPGYAVDAATYAACDFEREDPVERLRAAGLDPRQATLVIWEGVVPYPRPRPRSAPPPAGSPPASTRARWSPSTAWARTWPRASALRPRPGDPRLRRRPGCRPVRFGAPTTSAARADQATAGSAPSASTTSRCSTSATTAAIASSASSAWSPARRRCPTRRGRDIRALRERWRAVALDGRPARSEGEAEGRRRRRRTDRRRSVGAADDARPRARRGSRGAEEERALGAAQLDAGRDVSAEVVGEAERGRLAIGDIVTVNVRSPTRRPAHAATHAHQGADQRSDA